MRRIDLLVAGAVVGLAAWAVLAQVGRDPVGEAIEARPVVLVPLGEAVEDQDVANLNGERLRLHTLLGRRATVFYSWSTFCGCVEVVNPRLLPVIERFKPQGVSFVAVAGDPKDTKERAAERLFAQWARVESTRGLPPYGMILDATQRLCRQLGFREASQFAVLDANGYVRYRGTFDDNLKQPTEAFLEPALEAVLEGRRVEHPFRQVTGYGCRFGAPLDECPLLGPAR